MANEEIFRAFHNQLLRTGNDNNTFYVYNEDKTSMILYTEADPSNIKRMILEREGDKYIAINEVEQIREEIETEIRIKVKHYTNTDAVIDEVLEELDKLIKSED